MLPIWRIWVRDCIGYRVAPDFAANVSVPILDSGRIVDKGQIIINYNLECEMSAWLETSKVAAQQESSSLLKDIDTIQGVATVKQAVWQFLQVLL